LLPKGDFMSEEQNQASGQEEAQGSTASGQEQQKEEYVSRKAYEEVTRDMHKFKQKQKEESAARAELESKLKAQEEAELREKENWKELFEKKDNELNDFKEELSKKDYAITTQAKKNALRAEIGNIKDEYLSLAKLDQLELDEYGAVTQESLHNVANSFREEHPALVPSASAPKITNQAPDANSMTPSNENDINQLSLEEKKAKLMKVLLETNKNN